MTAAVIEEFHEMILEISTDSGATWSKICGMTDVTVNRTTNVDSTEIPDCDDESLPFNLVKKVRSKEMTVSGTGVWARGSQGMMKTWYHDGLQYLTRIHDSAAASGDIAYEQGTAILSNYSTSRTKGQSVTAEIELQFSGVVTTTNAA